MNTKQKICQKEQCGCYIICKQRTQRINMRIKTKIIHPTKIKYFKIKIFIICINFHL